MMINLMLNQQQTFNSIVAAKDPSAGCLMGTP